MGLIWKIIKNTILIVTIFLAVFYYNDIVDFASDFIDNYSYEQELKKIVIPKSNEYKLSYDYNYVKETNNFVPNSSEDIKNIVFTILNNGWDEFSFLCPKKYKNCLNDALEITNNDAILSDINSFVHPYNTFKTLSTTYTTTGKFTINVEKNYNDKMISEVNNRISDIISKEINSNMSDREKIRIIHDYIINNARYDDSYSGGSSFYYSNTAYGTLIEKRAICSGYTDAMALFLDKFNIPNYKISSERHIWNLVYIDNMWYHLDLTFDDPVTNTGDNVLNNDYFLINTSRLHSLDTEEHTFNSSVFIEAQ